MSRSKSEKKNMDLFLHFFDKTVFDSKISCISMSIKKNTILTHIAKKLQTRQFSKYCLSEKPLIGSKKTILVRILFFIGVDIGCCL